MSVSDSRFASESRSPRGNKQKLSSKYYYYANIAHAATKFYVAIDLHGSPSRRRQVHT